MLLLEVRDRQVAENTVETKSNVYGCVRFRQPVQKICHLKRRIHARKSGEIARQSPSSFNLRDGDIETPCGNSQNPSR